MNTAFRKVDVDQYEEEKYEDDVDTDTGVTVSETEVQALLGKYPLRQSDNDWQLSTSIKTQCINGLMNVQKLIVLF